jgi:hypothetical protein
MLRPFVLSLMTTMVSDKSGKVTAGKVVTGVQFTAGVTVTTVDFETDVTEALTTQTPVNLPPAKSGGQFAAGVVDTGGVP